MSSGGEYVVAAYGVVLFALLVYVVVIGLKSARQARETELLAKLIESRADAEDDVMDALEPVDR
ncbi:hypothetical protein [Miltoncostaea oceani]|uniref:hypothetical protein n=1 Tax=Miltoncostaea oceani TaxID=2843216 RepID=UPI001C3E3D02|nr:hypothetical protein [Miltoncostaea oceani]